MTVGLGIVETAQTHQHGQAWVADIKAEGENKNQATTRGCLRCHISSSATRLKVGCGQEPELPLVGNCLRIPPLLNLKIRLSSRILSCLVTQPIFSSYADIIERVS